MRYGAWLLGALVLAVPGTATATSMAANPPLVEMVARRTAQDAEESNPLRWPRAFGGYDRAGAFHLVVSRVVTEAERRDLEALARAQREDDAPRFAAALSDERPWIRDEALAALPHGRLASGFDNALVPMRAARTTDVEFVARFLPDLRRLATSPPPTAHASAIGATPVLATKCLLWLAHHAHGPALADALDAAVEGLAATAYWQSVRELDEAMEA